MDLLTLSTGFVLAFLAAAVITRIIIRYAHGHGCLDTPDTVRKLHEQPTPTLGGVAIVCGVAVGVGAILAASSVRGVPIGMPALGFWAGAALVVGAGVWDDVRGMNPKTKFVFQLLAAYVLLHAGYRVDLTELGVFGEAPFQHALYSIPITILWVVGLINAVNLLDGLDGLAAGISIIALASLALVFAGQGDISAVALGLIAIGAASGFLIYNFRPASIFMGDAGSLFLGYVLAAYSLDLSASFSGAGVGLIIPIVALGIPITDTTVSIIRRFLTRRAIFAPDNDHIHHRLHQLISHRGAVLTLYAVALWFGLAAVIMGLAPPVVGYVVAGVALVTTAVGLRVVGYLQAREAFRGLRYRIRLYQRRHITPEIDQRMQEAQEIQSLLTSSGHKPLSTDEGDNDKPELLHADS